MQINTQLTLVITPVVNAVVFGIGAVAILATPQLAEAARVYLPIWIGLSIVFSPVIARVIAPRMRSKAYHLGFREP